MKDIDLSNNQRTMLDHIISLNTKHREGDPNTIVMCILKKRNMEPMNCDKVYFTYNGT